MEVYFKLKWDDISFLIYLLKHVKSKYKNADNIPNRLKSVLETLQTINNSLVTEIDYFDDDFMEADLSMTMLSLQETRPDLTEKQIEGFLETVSYNLENYLDWNKLEEDLDSTYSE